MVVLSDHAKLGSESAAEGTRVYDGDRLSTEADGSMRIMVGEAIVYLPDQSCVTLHKGASGAAKEFETDLVSGSVVLSETVGHLRKLSRERLASGRSGKREVWLRLGLLNRRNSLFLRGADQHRFLIAAKARRLRKGSPTACC